MATAPVKCCEACGRPLPEQEKNPKGGPPVIYCDATCSRFQRALVAVLADLNEMRRRMTPLFWLMLRRSLWGETNARPWNRGVTRGDAVELLRRVRR